MIWFGLYRILFGGKYKNRSGQLKIFSNIWHILLDTLVFVYTEKVIVNVALERMSLVKQLNQFSLIESILRKLLQILQLDRSSNVISNVVTTSFPSGYTGRNVWHCDIYTHVNILPKTIYCNSQKTSISLCEGNDVCESKRSCALKCNR